MGEQRYKAVMAVVGGGRTVTEVARDWEVSRLDDINHAIASGARGDAIRNIITF